MPVAIDQKTMYRRMQESGIPAHMHDGLVAYILRGLEGGSFLMAVLTNDLAEACHRADEQNKSALWAYVFYLYNYAPLGCWHSEANVKAWIKQGGLLGRQDVSTGAEKEAQDGSPQAD